MNSRQTIMLSLVCAMGLGLAQAKLPPPSEEAKAKAEEAKAKAAYGDKLAAFQLCKSMDQVAQRYFKESKARAGKPLETPPCQDPGPFQAISSAPQVSSAAVASASAKKP